MMKIIGYDYLCQTNLVNFEVKETKNKNTNVKLNIPMCYRFGTVAVKRVTETQRSLDAIVTGTV